MQEKIFCNKCGNPAAKTDKFCMNCGKNINSDSSDSNYNDNLQNLDEDIIPDEVNKLIEPILHEGKSDGPLKN